MMAVIECRIRNYCVFPVSHTNTGMGVHRANGKKRQRHAHRRWADAHKAEDAPNYDR